MRKWNVGVAAGVVIALLASTGCVTKKVYRKDVEQTDTRVRGVESAVEANERRIADISKETDSKVAGVRAEAQRAIELGNSAMTQAKSAEQMARGKILWSVTLSDDRVRFGFGKAAIPPEAATALDDLAARVKGMNKAVYVEIQGHTDDIGTGPYNLKLGEKRANAVRDYLYEKGGIPLHAMNVISYGSSQPVAANSTSQGRAQNRRVVIRVLE